MAVLPTTAPTAAPARRGRGRRFPSPQRLVFYVLFLGVPLVIYLVFVVSPFFQAFYYSLTDWRGLTSATTFVGLDNYVTIFADEQYRTALLHNLILLIVLPVITIGLAFTLAVMVTVGGDSRGAITGIRGSNIYRVVSFFPYVIPAVVVGILFAFIYSPNGGLINGVLGIVGLDRGIGWLGDPRFALAAIVLAVVWSLVGFYMVLFVAAIKAVPAEVVEAARLDGAGRGRLALQIILPMIRENVSTAVVYMGIMALDMFVYISVMTPNGGTGGSTDVVSRYLYQTAFQKSQFGLASAMGVVLALVTMLMAVLVLFGTRQKDVR